MRDWNTVATTREGGFRRAWDILSRHGQLWRTEFYNVLVMRVDELAAFLSWLESHWAEDEEPAAVLAHVRPLRRTFSFQSPEEFEERAAALALGFVPQLRGMSFHVRVHRRGFKARLSSATEERLLADVVLARLAAEGPPGRVAFDEPDAILGVETVGTRGGMSLWTRDDLKRYLFLGLD